MASKTECSTEEAQFLRRLGLHLSDKHWSDFHRQDHQSGRSQQRVSRIGLRLTDSLFNHSSPPHHLPGEGFEGEVSRWSSDSSEDGNEKSDRDAESEAKGYFQETIKQRLERHRRFFQGEPLMRCLTEEEARYHEWMDTLFYNNLCHEVQHNVHETRRQDVVRAYWKDVQEKLAVEDSEISDTSNLTTDLQHEYGGTLSSSHLGSVARSSPGWKRPVNMCSSSGKDLDLQKVRDFWFQKKKNLRRATTIGKVEGQESGNDTSMLFRREALGRAATFG